MYASTSSYPSALSTPRYSYGAPSLTLPSSYHRTGSVAPSTRFRDAIAATRSPAGGYGRTAIGRSTSAAPSLGRGSSYYGGLSSYGSKDSAALLAAPMRSVIRGNLDDVELNSRIRFRYMEFYLSFAGVNQDY